MSVACQYVPKISVLHDKTNVTGHVACVVPTIQFVDSMNCISGS
jgi:hypothetical protein